jgi:cytochrome c biogenesis protein CcmG/thiol:disulfide interchange protein DsbE
MDGQRQTRRRAIHGLREQRLMAMMAYHTILSLVGTRPSLRQGMRLAVFAAGLLGSVLSQSVVWAAPVMDQSAPSLVLTQLNGEVFDLAKMRGKVVLVNYWATWCAPCKKEMPILNSFYRRHRGDGLEIIGVSADRPQDFAKMRKMSGSLAYPTATMNEVTDNGFGPPEGFPLTYVVDRNGVIRDRFIDVREQLLTDVVLPLMAH